MDNDPEDVAFMKEICHYSRMMYYVFQQSTYGGSIRLKVYDVSVQMHGDMVVWPGDPKFRRDLVSAITNGDRSNVSILSCSTHCGTHVDAPFHFLEDGATLDRVAPEQLVGFCRVVEVICDGDITRDHLEKALKDGDIREEDERLLFKTLNSSRNLMQSPEFHKDYCAIAPSAAEWIVHRKVKTVGVDYLSVERFHPEIPRTHPILLGNNVFVIEGLNLTQVPAGEYLLTCGAWNILGADGSPARVFLLSDI
jgi:arylformamidase